MSESAISFINDVSTTWLAALWRATWQGAIAVGIVWAICKCAPRIPAAYRAWLWWIACLKLATGLFSPIVLPVLPAQKPVPVAISNVSPPAPAYTEPAAPPMPAELTPNATVDPLPSRSTVASVASLQALVAAMWAGAVIALVLSMVSGWLQLAAMRRIAKAAGPQVQELATDTAGKVGIRVPEVLASSPVRSPMAMGLIRPVVLMPENSEQKLSTDEIRMALAHEMTHIRRGDLWTSLLPSAIRAIFFFNPLARLASREFSIAREEACDVDTLRLTQQDPGSYGRLLLKVITTGGKSRYAESVGALGAATNFRHLERRLKMLNNNHEAFRAGGKRLPRMALMSIGLTGVICALPWQLAAAQDPQPDQEIGVLPPRPAKPTQVEQTPEAEPGQSSRTAPRATRARRPTGTLTAPAAPSAAPLITTVPATRALSAPRSTAAPALRSIVPARPATRVAPRATPAVDGVPGVEVAPEPNVAIAVPATTTVRPSVSITAPVAVTVDTTPITTVSPNLQSLQTTTPVTVQGRVLSGRARAVEGIDASGRVLAPITTSGAPGLAAVVSQYGQTRGVTFAGSTRSLTGSLRPVTAQGLTRAGSIDSRTITVDLGETTVYAALRELFKMAGVSYRIDDNVREIASSTSFTMAVVDMPFKTALNMVLASTRNSRTPLSYSNEGGFYVITAGRSGGRTTVDPVREPKPAATGTTKPARAASRVPVLSDVPIVKRFFTNEPEKKADPLITPEKKPGAPEDPLR